jgi:hypothetical protein
MTLIYIDDRRQFLQGTIVISVWDRTSIKYTTVVITTSGLSAAMLDLMVIGNPSSFALHVPALAVPDSMITAFDINILSQIQPEI